MQEINIEYLKKYYRKVFIRYLFNRLTRIEKMINDADTSTEIINYIEKEKITVLNAFNITLSDVYKEES